ncbi:MAG: hypothetical protein ABI947_10570 [Chloroflexota bacterium]
MDKQTYTCLRCGQVMVNQRCKLQCPRCGYTEDCADAGLIDYDRTHESRRDPPSERNSQCDKHKKPLILP